MRAFQKFEEKTNLADSTMKQYKGILNKILKPYKIPAVELSMKDAKDIFNDYKKIIEYIDNIDNTSTKKNYYSFLVKFVRTIFPKNNFYVKYNDKLKENQNKIDTRYENGKLTEKQKKNWKDWNDIIDTRDNLKENVDKLREKYKKGELNKVDYAYELLDFIILGLYTYQNPRRNEDYTNMKLMTKLLDNESVEKNTNYYYPGDNEVPAHFVFQNFKTKKNYSEPVRIPVNSTLKKYIDEFLKLFKKKPKYALNQIVRDEGLRTDQIIKSLKRTTGLTSNNFRMAFLTEMLGPTLELEKKKKELAYNMGHSKSQMKYVKDLKN